MKKILFLALLIGGTKLSASQEPDKIQREVGSYYVAVMPVTELKNSSLEPAKQITVKLFKRFTILAKEIGSIHFTYYPTQKQRDLTIVKKKELLLTAFKINPDYRNLSLGSFLFKYALAYNTSSFDCAIINWSAYPIENPTPQNLQRIVTFYSNAGAIKQGEHSGRNTRKNFPLSCVKMYYPLRSAQMLTVLLPILEPKPISKNQKKITLPNGKEYISSPHDALGIIANYMGETDHSPEVV